ncbi:hypothetical protein [Formosa algae]|uniref:hypothetical protein n=1 Tax=Formosa algae TaxID=225843 RepID=UPI000CCED0D9|nr:hypothetical protein [Formosa algae]PNW27013.1 hypothetical protein BKP44_14535 [Formosa algae]
MKKILLILIIGILFANCADKKDKLEATEIIKSDKAKSEKEIEYIDRWNQIELAQTDDEFGEWGGNSDIIVIFSDGEKLYANYSRYLGSYKPPKPPKENEIPKKWYEYKELESRIDSVELNSEQIELIENAILELTELKINSKSYPAHSGIVNTVISRDSSLIIEDYPSKEWKSFQNLKKSITEK